LHSPPCLLFSILSYPCFPVRNSHALASVLAPMIRKS
jgi:hypothetical protein